MKIAIISLIRRGGMVHFHSELVNSISKIVPTIAIISSETPSTYYSSETSKLLVYARQGALGTFINAINPFFWYKLYKILQASRADIFHIVASHAWNPILGLLLSFLKKPLIFTLHDPEHHLGTPVYMRISDALLLKESNAVIVLSNLGREQLLAKGLVRNKIFHIPHGVYSFFTEFRTKHLVQEKMILFFGRIEPYKGLDILLAAFSRVADTLPGWKLVIAGNGDLTPYLTALHHPQIEVINKYIPDEETADLMERCRMVVLPYIEATQSGVIPIAYAFARPVIATDVGSLKEMVIHGRTGLLIPPGDSIKLAQTIKTLATDDLFCSQMGHYAFEWSRSEWSWERIAQLHFELYSKVIERYV